MNNPIYYFNGDKCLFWDTNDKVIRFSIFNSSNKSAKHLCTFMSNEQCQITIMTNTIDHLQEKKLSSRELDKSSFVEFPEKEFCEKKLSSRELDKSSFVEFPETIGSTIGIVYEKYDGNILCVLTKDSLKIFNLETEKIYLEKSIKNHISMKLEQIHECQKSESYEKIYRSVIEEFPIQTLAVPHLLDTISSIRLNYVRCVGKYNFISVKYLNYETTYVFSHDMTKLLRIMDGSYLIIKKEHGLFYKLSRMFKNDNSYHIFAHANKFNVYDYEFKNKLYESKSDEQIKEIANDWIVVCKNEHDKKISF